MNDRRNSGVDDSDIDLDTQELVRPVPEEPLGYGHGEWASGSFPRKPEKTQVGSESGLEQRVRDTEATLDTLRDITSKLEREIALVRADFERLRQESQRAAGSKLP